jgi:hypothetical protein
VTGINSASASGIAFTRLYHNDGNAVFTAVSHPFPDCYLGAASWGDYDNDGHLDLVLCGATTGGGLVSAIWHNDGHGSFTNSGIALPAMDLGFAVWGDYNNDGQLDLPFGGNTDAGFINRIYHNDGNGVFTDINAGLLPVIWASATWGDYDNDGKLDIMTIGYDPVAQVARSILYRYTGTNFVDTGATFHNLYLGTLSWFDYDNDGRLDVIMEGNEVGTDILRIAHNTTLTTNTPPSAPSNLTVSFTGTNVDLSWDAGSDTQTPAAGLTYNLRVGTTPGGSETLAPHSASNGRRRIAAMGNMNLARAAQLRGVIPGTTYYWSVQAVDTGFAGSAFASETSFTMPPESPVCILFIRDPAGTVHSTWHGSANFTYHVEASSDLQHWTTVTNLAAAPGSGLFDFSETPGPEIARRFYRAAFP